VPGSEGLAGSYSPSELARCFPRGFRFGAATSAYQIEGDPLADGAGPSIWHDFSHEPGRIADGSNGDAACGHYRRMREDVALMASLGLSVYRFSVAWARVLPQGTGAVNAAGLDFYDRLVDALLGHGIEPMLTLYHWDLPSALQARGGWQHPDSPQWFADYAECVAGRLGDRVRYWITLNEPWVIAVLGHYLGEHAPGIRDAAAHVQVMHQLVHAHAAAELRLRAMLPAGQIGVAVNLAPQHPASDLEADQRAAGRRDAWFNHWFLDAVLRGRYPHVLLQPDNGPGFGPEWPMALLRRLQEELPSPARPDFLGINYYSRERVRADPADALLGAAPLPPAALGAPVTTMGWEIYPAGLTETLEGVTGRYGRLPLWVTENGAACPDRVRDPNGDIEGAIVDTDRIHYLSTHLHAAAAAMAQGVDLRGYCVWSLLDNFEWALGYGPRFGLVEMLRGSLERRRKFSARWYQSLIAAFKTRPV